MKRAVHVALKAILAAILVLVLTPGLRGAGMAPVCSSIGAIPTVQVRSRILPTSHLVPKPVASELGIRQSLASRPVQPCCVKEEVVRPPAYVLTKEWAEKFVFELLYYINQGRAAVGVPPIEMITVLRLAADERAADMAVNNYFGHQHSTGEWPYDVAQRFGYQTGQVAECIAAWPWLETVPDARRVYDAWENSEKGHRLIMLYEPLRHAGIAIVFDADYDPSDEEQLYPWYIVFLGGFDDDHSYDPAPAAPPVLVVPESVRGLVTPSGDSTSIFFWVENGGIQPLFWTALSECSLLELNPLSGVNDALVGVSLTSIPPSSTSCGIMMQCTEMCAVSSAEISVEVLLVEKIPRTYLPMVAHVN